MTIEILNQKAVQLLQDLEDLELIKVVNDSDELKTKVDLSTLRGSINTGLTVDEIDAQFKNLRNEWERDFS